MVSTPTKMSSITFTYTFSVPRSAVENDDVWKHLLNVKKDVGDKPLEVSDLLSSNTDLDDQLTDALIEQIEEDILEKCPHCCEQKANVEFKRDIHGHDTLVCESCNNELQEEEDEEAKEETISITISEYLDLIVRPKGKTVTLGEYRKLKAEGLWEAFKAQK